MSPTRRRLRLWVFVLGAACFATARGETIGPYEVVAAPTSATLVIGGGAGFNWLNVVNAPVTIDEAFTGFSLIDDGYGNGSGGTTLLLTFAPGVLRNHPGPDLVLFDGSSQQKAYLVRTSHDGFVAQIVVAGAFSDTGVDRSYFFGGQGPTPFDVMAATIDLSALNVPNGQAVDQVRLFAEVSGNDTLGLGVLAGPPQVPALSQWGLASAGLLLLAAGARLLVGRPAPQA